MASTGEVWKLGNRPALDGVRGIAVLLVVAAHATEGLGLPANGLGGSGVTMFFVLSGFLITSLLLEEQDRVGRLRLWAFYQRRARRLLPALVVMLLATLALGLASAVGALAALFYVANWFQAATQHNGGLAHTWSLAVEEQFYVLWPLVVLAVARLPRKALLWVALVGAGASFALRVVLYDGTALSDYQVQRWTHTAADPILIGCALAVAMRGAYTGQARPPVASLLMVVALGLAVLGGPMQPVALPLVVAVLTACIIFACCSGPYSGWLTGGAVTWLGRRSYAVYLWHVPVLTAAGRLGLGGLTRSVAAVAVTLLVAESSWQLVERRFLAPRSLEVDAGGGVLPDGESFRSAARAGEQP